MSPQNVSRISAQVSRTVKDLRFSMYSSFMAAGRRSESKDRFLIWVSVAKGSADQDFASVRQIWFQQGKEGQVIHVPTVDYILEWNVI